MNANSLSYHNPISDADPLPDFDAPRPAAAIRFRTPVHAALRNPQTGEVCPLELADTTLLVCLIHCGWTFAQEGGVE